MSRGFHEALEIGYLVIGPTLIRAYDHTTAAVGSSNVVETRDRFVFRLGEAQKDFERRIILSAEGLEVCLKSGVPALKRLDDRDRYIILQSIRISLAAEKIPNAEYGKALIHGCTDDKKEKHLGYDVW